MPAKWSEGQKQERKVELIRLYVKENKTIFEVGETLGIAYQTVFGQLKKLNIRTCPRKKPGYLLTPRKDIVIPRKRSIGLAEFFGIMHGDGNLSHYQCQVTLGTKEASYVRYVQKIMKSLFRVNAKICIRAGGKYQIIYIGSTELTDWLQKEGLVFNKVASQVDVPRWILNNKSYMKAWLKGFFDTDGSIYKLRWGTQIEFTNHSAPLLHSARKMLLCLNYSPSKVSGSKVYITKKDQVKRFFREIKPANSKHVKRYNSFKNG